MPRCRCVVRYGVGVDNVEVAAATDLGIVVANVVDFCTEEVANHALLLLLACAKRLLPLDADLRAGHWRRTPLAGLPSVWGQTLGIVGLGNIGRSLARKALALQMTRPRATTPTVQARRRRGTLPPPLGWRCEELLVQSDFVSVSAPLTAETRHLIGAAELALDEAGRHHNQRRPRPAGGRGGAGGGAALGPRCGGGSRCLRGGASFRPTARCWACGT